MRQALWPSPAREHAREIERYFAGTLREPIEVFLAFDEQGQAIGLIELSIRAYAEGCATDRVAFVEGRAFDIRQTSVSPDGRAEMHGSSM